MLLLQRAHNNIVLQLRKEMYIKSIKFYRLGTLEGFKY